MKLNFLIILCAGLTAGCISEKKCRERYPVPVTTDIRSIHDTTYSVRDSLIPLPADSAWIKALLECQNGKVVVKEIQSVVPGKKIKPFLNLKDNVLMAGGTVDSSSVYFAWKETHIKDSESKTVTIEKRVNYVTGFQNFMIWWGWISAIVVLIFVGFRLIRLYFKMHPL
jgi:hypothetical protein